MSYSTYDSRFADLWFIQKPCYVPEVLADMISFFQEMDKPKGKQEYLEDHIKQLKFMLLCHRLGWEEFVGVYSLKEGRAFCYNPKDNRQFLMSLFVDDDWRTP